MLRVLELRGSICTFIDGTLHLLLTFLLLQYPLTFLKSGESTPVWQEASCIDAWKDYMLVTILNAEANGFRGGSIQT
jgi:hypothetical protein